MSKMSQISREFELPIIQRDAILKEMKKLLTEYGYEYKTDALLEIIDTWAKRKGWIINLLSKNENWNADKFQIQFSHDYERAVNMSILYQFVNWAKDEVFKVIPEYKYTGLTMPEIINICDRLNRQIELIRDLRQTHAPSYGYNEITINGKSYSEMLAEQDRFLQLKRRMEYEARELHGRYAVYAEKRDAKKYNDLVAFFNIIIEYFEGNIGTIENIHLCPVELKEQIDDIFPDVARRGQKISKIIQKVCIMYDLDKVKVMKEVTHNGVTQEKDFGWNYWKAMLGDAINPLKFSRHTIISVNPIDYLTMSFGHNWCSCHTIDINGYRDTHDYRGEYSAGTISYMLDCSSIIFYTVDSAYDGTEFELQDKMQRVVFAVGEDKLYEGRVYPDGRDGGDAGLASQFRVLMQKIVADALEATNLWVFKKGTGACTDVMCSAGGVAYPDWQHYGDCNMSFLKDGNNVNLETFRINAAPISIVTGEVHSCEDNIEGDTDSIGTCEHCGHAISRYDDYVRASDGSIFCDYECAEAEAYYYCEDVDEWTDNCYYDEYTQEYFADDSNLVEVEGNWGTQYYANAEHAEADGYYYCENEGDWYHEDDTRIDPYTGERFYPNDDTIETVDGNHYVDSNSAECDGYVEVDGEWVKREEETA